MNKLLYRLIFNKSRGLLMAVAETARSGGKGVGGTRAAGVPVTGAPARLNPLAQAVRGALAVLVAGGSWLLADPAVAQIKADRGAPHDQQATVLNTANGVAQVNIQTPSAAGVSRNTYSQFDVPSAGAILNNSRTEVQTQLGGWVSGNPWMAASTGARVIVNEVNSSTPSQLRGYLEVAGRRAEVVVANAAGIVVDGGGFINVSRATLTTGTTQWSNGALDGYAVRDGVVSVQGAGLDARTTDYTGLIARAVELNGGVWGQRLGVVAGANLVGAVGGTADPVAQTIAGTGPAPHYGIDASQLGGMYANQITLVGTEAGVGVRNAGTLGAAAGDVVVTSAGHLESSGTIAASGQLHMQGQEGIANSGALASDGALVLGSGADLVNSGSVTAGTGMALTATGALTNSGKLSAQTDLQAQADSLINSGTIKSNARTTLALRGDADNQGGTISGLGIDLTSSAGGINNHGGAIIQGGDTGLEIRAAALANTHGGQLGMPAQADPGGATPPADTSGGSGGGAIGGAGGATPPATTNGGVAPGGGAANGAPAPMASGVLQAAGVLNNDAGVISVGGPLSLAVATLDNSGGTLALDRLAFSGPSFSNHGGKLTIGHDLSVRTDSFDNAGGTLLVGTTFDAQLGQFDNTGGLLQAGLLRVAVDGGLDNTRGVLRQTGAEATQLSVGGSLNNAQGTLEMGGSLALAAGSIAGQGGKLTVLGDLQLDTGAATLAGANWLVNGNVRLHTGALDTSSSLLSAGGDLALDSSALSNGGGKIVAAGANTITVGGALDNAGGTLQAGAEMNLAAGGALNNQGGAIEAIGATSTLHVRADAIDNTAGRIVNAGAGEASVASAHALLNTGLIGANGDLELSAQSLRNEAGATVSAGGALTLALSERLDNAGTIGSAGALSSSQAGAVWHNSGQISAGGAIDLAVQEINNDGGLIGTAAGSGAGLSLAGATLSNRAGTIASDGSFALTATTGGLDNTGGQLRALGGGGVLTVAQTLGNHGGVIEADGAASGLQVQAGAIDNGDGHIVASGLGASSVMAANMLASDGQIAANGDLALAADTLRNGGTVSAGGTLDVSAASVLENTGLVSSAGRLRLGQASATIHNRGQIVAGDALAITAAMLDNDGGQIATTTESGADLSIAAAGLSNQGGRVQAGGSLAVAVRDDLNNTQGMLQAARSVDLVAGGALANAGGIVEAQGADATLAVRAGAIDNTAGRIVNVGTGTADVHSDGDLLNGGTIAGNGALTLSAATLENLAAGNIAAGQALAVTVGQRLDNQGAIGSGGTLDISGASADIGNHGTIAAGAAAHLLAGNLNNDGGQIATATGSGADLTIASASLSNLGGKLVADGSAQLAIAGALENTNGTIHAGQDMQLAAAGALGNQDGTIEATGSAGTLTLTAQSIDNSGAGRIVNAGTGATSVSSTSAILNTGLIAGNGQLALQAQSLDNGAGGTVAAGTGLALAISEALTNAGTLSAAAGLDSQDTTVAQNRGRIVSGGTVTLSAGSWNNDGGQIVTTAGSGADISLHSGSLSNQGGTIAADRDVQVTTDGALGNANGTIQAGRDARLVAGSALDNTAGLVAAAGTLDLQAGTIDNSAGRIVNAGGGATIVAVQDLLINGGQIAGNGDVSLAAARLQNGAGATVASGAGLTLDLSLQLANEGVISSGGALDFRQATVEVANSGQIVAGGAAHVQAGNWNNDGGQLATAQGSSADLTLQAHSLSNRGGAILADGSAVLGSDGALDNTQGTVQAGKDLQLSAGGILSNDAGAIEALGAASTLTVDAADLANGGGRIANRGNGDTSVSSAGNIANAGLIAGNGNVALAALTLDNGGAGNIGSGGALSLGITQQLTNEGTINSSGTLSFDQAAATLRNSGQILSGGDAIVHADTVDNNGGQIRAGTNLTLTAQQLSNDGGQLSAESDLAVSTHTLLAPGAMAAGRDLSLSLDGDYALGAGAALQANRDLNLHVGGDLSNAGKLGAVRNLSLSAGQLDNLAGATIAAQNMNVMAAGAVNNAGEITASGALDIGAATVANSGAIIGDTATLQARTIDNTGASALVGATTGLTLLAADTLNNSAGATIYSAGNLAIGGDAAGNPANTVNNRDATIEADGDLALAAGTLNNVRSNVNIVNVKTLDETVHMNLPSWQKHGNNSNYFDAASSNYNPHISYFVNPADVLSNKTIITPDGQTIGQVVFTTHANDSVFYSAWGGLYSSYGDSARLSATDGTMTLYYTVQNEHMANPDQGGPADNAYINDGAVTSWGPKAPAFSSAYGSCGSDCIRFVTQPGYDDPSTTLIRDTATRSLAAPGGLEASLDAHHTVSEDQLAPGAGSGGQILSGGDMHLTVGQALNNEYSNILAGGVLTVDGQAIIRNQGATLYTTHAFDGSWTADNGTVTAYTNPSISTVSGTVGGVLKGSQGVNISGVSFNNIDVTAGTVGNLRDSVNVIGQARQQASLAGAVGASGAANGATVAGAASAGGQADASAGPSRVEGGGLGGAVLAGAAGGGGLTGVATGRTNISGGASLAGNAQAVGGATAGAAGGGRNIVDVAPNGLSLRNPDPNGPVFETRPQFANRGNWTSSDYQLQQLGYDPATVQKRLGDGYYEGRLVAQQLAELTGRAPAGGQADDALYQQLLTNGVGYAKQWNLRPGIALSADQMAQLTSDIVWLVSETVRLPDGTTQEVLVPKVYLAHAGASTVKASGALVTGDGVSINTTDGIVNRGGVIDGGNGRTVLIAGGNIVNQGGAIKGGAVGLLAGGDVVNESLAVQQDYASSNRYGASGGSYTTLSNQASITATGALAIVAGRDVVDTGGTIGAASANVSAGRDIAFKALQTGSSYQAQVGQSTAQDSSVHYKVGSIATTGDVAMVAGRDLTLNGAQVAAGTSGKGDALLVAGRDLTVTAVVDSVNTDLHNAPGGAYYDKQVHQDQTVVGAGVTSAGNVLLRAGASQTGTLTVTGSTIDGGGAVVLAASGDVNINAVAESHLSDTAHHSESHGTLKSSSETTADYSSVHKMVGSSVGGGTVDVQAGHDLTVAGSTVAGDGDVRLAAAHSVNITAVTEQSTESHYSKVEEKGFMSGGGLGFSVGTRTTTTDQRQDATTQSGQARSQVGSIGGSLSISAGDALKVVGSDLVAGGDMTLTGKSVAITPGQDAVDGKSSSKTTQDGLTVALGGSVVNAIQTGQSMATAAGKTSNTRMKALAAAAAAMTAKDAAADLAKNGPSVSVSATVGHSESETSQVTASRAHSGSTLTANNISISATGGGKDSNLDIVGSDVRAAGNVTLKADNQVNLLAAQDTDSQHSTSKSMSAAVGVAAQVSSQGASYGLTANASASRGNIDGEGTTQLNSHVDAGNRLTIVSGDTHIKGAVASGNQVVTDIKGNLNIESLQDTATLDGKNQSVSASVTMGTGGGVSASQSKVHNDYASVQEQSGIKAGDGGFQAKVAGNTDLKGGVIASSEQAIQDGRNSLATGTLTFSDIANRDSHDASGVSLGVNVGKNEKGDTFNPSMAPGVGQVSGSQGSVTRSGVSGGALAVAGEPDGQAAAGLNRDVSTGKDTAQALTKGWTGAQALGEVQAQMQITSTAMPRIAKEIGDYADTKQKELKDNPEEAAKWAEGGTYRVAAHAALGAMGGGLGGAVGAAAAADVAPTLGTLQGAVQGKLAEAGLSNDAASVAAKLIAGGAAGAIGGVVGGVAGVATGMNEDANNRQLHPGDYAVAKTLAAKSGGQYTEKEIQDALRYSGLKDSNGNIIVAEGTSETFVNNVNIHTGMSLQDTVKADPTMAIVAIPGDQTTLLENAPNRPSNELMAYIAANTGGKSSPYVLTPGPVYTTVQSLPDAPTGTTRVSRTIDGAVYFPLVAPCPAASCSNGDPIANAIPDDGTKAYNEAVARKTEKDINIATTLLSVGGAAVRGVIATAELATTAGAGARVAEAAGATGTVDLNTQASLSVSKVTAPIDFDGHVLSAEIKQNGNVVGGHTTATGDVQVIPGTAGVPNAQGVYSAKIQVADPSNPGQFLPKTNNGGVSTLFPDSWTVDRIKVEVDAAFQNRTVVGNKWTGTTPSGVQVEGYLSPKTTVYPKL